ncbi:MAG: hypothetical protein KGH53_01065 [Candidatus Micrarchaeota archaeon]|nr:hypothetical protein [Candidatus Micrarchaeota archaeon]
MTKSATKLGRDDAGRCKTLIQQAGNGNIDAAITLSTFYSKSKLTRVINKNITNPSLRKTFAEMIMFQAARRRDEIREKNSLRE